MGSLECKRPCTRDGKAILTNLSSQYLQLVPPKPRPAPTPAPPPARRAPPAAPSVAASSRVADSSSAPVSVMPGMGNGGGLAAILAAKRAAAAAEDSSPPASNGSTPAASRPGSSLGGPFVFSQGGFHSVLMRILNLIGKAPPPKIGAKPPAVGPKPGAKPAIPVSSGSRAPPPPPASSGGAPKSTPSRGPLGGGVAGGPKPFSAGDLAAELAKRGRPVKD